MRTTIFAALGLAIGISASANAATFSGEFWDHDASLGSIAEARSVIASRVADVTFESTLIDYPRGAASDITDATQLVDFLGPDGTGLVGDGTADLTQSVFRFTGFIDLGPTGSSVTVGSDDGFELTIASFTMFFDGNRSFAETTAVAPLEGILPFELIYWENEVVTGVEFSIDGNLATPQVPPIPLPASALLLVTGLGALVVFGRRQSWKLAVDKA